MIKKSVNSGCPCWTSSLSFFCKTKQKKNSFNTGFVFRLFQLKTGFNNLKTIQIQKLSELYCCKKFLEKLHQCFFLSFHEFPISVLIMNFLPGKEHFLRLLGLSLLPEKCQTVK